MFNSIFCCHYFPEEWIESIGVALRKPGKARNDPKNYRPITMTSCLGKLFERMISKRLAFFLQQNKLLSRVQCGFSKNHSPIDHLIRLESDIRKGYKKKNSMLQLSSSLLEMHMTWFLSPLYCINFSVLVLKVIWPTIYATFCPALGDSALNNGPSCLPYMKRKMDFHKVVAFLQFFSTL